MLFRPVHRWLLPASLSLNLFLGGMAASHLLRPDFPPRPPRPEQMVEELASRLDPADGAILRQSFAAHAPDLEKAHRSKRAMFDQVRTVLGAETFDPAALRAIFAEAQAAHVAMDDALVQALIDAASRMSPAGRRTLADWAPPGPPGGPRP